MDRKVELRLSEMVNESETTLDFIRDTENEFNIAQQSFEDKTVEQLNDYIEFLDELWNK
jgi:hypothetical protein